MSPIEKYAFMRQAGFTHEEAQRFINKGVNPNLNTEMKRRAFKRLTDTKGEASGTEHM